ncbi:MAG: hypothetical protein HC933_00690 [Pleurocapsa sp. SU_196_0]|nr:hypothetical protein [Pleurocapsa sp. SU_196_0]
MTINRKSITANPAEELFNSFLQSEYAAMPELEDDGSFIPTVAAKTIIAGCDWQPSSTSRSHSFTVRWQRQDRPCAGTRRSTT